MERDYMSGQPKSGIASRYHVPVHSVDYHMEHHLSRQLVKAYEMKESMEGLNIIQGVEELLGRTRSILDKAEHKKNYRLSLDAIREMRGNYELLARIAHALHSAKLAELEMESLKQSQVKQSLQEQAGDMLQVLDDDELKVWERLSRKLRTQNADLKALPLKYRMLPAPFPNDEAYETGDDVEYVGQSEDQQEDPDIRIRKKPGHTEIPSSDTDPKWFRKPKTGPMRRSR